MPQLCIILLCALALPLTLPKTGSCFPQGGGSLSLMHRYTGQDSSTATNTTLNESLLRLDLYQTVPGYGRLFLSSDLSRTDSSTSGDYTSLSRYQIGLEGYRLGKWTNTLLAGDASIRFTNLVEGFPGPFPSLLAVKPFLNPVYAADPARFLNATYPDINFRGGVLNSVSDNDALLVFGGKLATIKGFQANEVDLTDESLFGVKWAHKWASDTYAGVGIIQTVGQQREGKPGGAKLSNTIFLLDGSYRLNRYVRLVGEYRENLFTQNGESTNDRALKAGSMVLLPRGALEFNYRRVGPNFLFVRENLQPERDVEGVFTSVDYKLHDNLTLYSSLDWNRSNLEDNRRVPAVNTLSALLGGYFFHPLLPSLNLRLALTDRGSRETSSVPVDSRNYTIYLETLKAFKLATPYLRLQGEMVNDGVFPENSYKSGTVGLGVRVTPLNTLNFFLEGEEQVRNTDSGATTASFRTKGGVSFIPRPNLALHANAEYSTIKDSPAGTTLKSISLSGGTMLTLPDQYYLNGDIRYNSTRFNGFSSTDSSILQFTVGLIKRFGWGRAGMAAVSGLIDGGLMADVGDIEGDVFQDLNRNVIRDAGEPGIAHAAILLEDGSKAVTDADGRYHFRNIATGIHLVRIDERGLDASLNLLTNPSQRVELKLRETTKVQFPLIRAGSIRGKVLIDANDNGTADPDDTPLPDVMIYIADSKTNTFSDADGNFALENLLPGRYEVRIDTTGLPEGMKLVSPDRYAADVKSGDEVKNIAFLVATEKKEIRKKVFGSGAKQAPAPVIPATEKKTASVQESRREKGAAALVTAPLQSVEAVESQVVEVHFRPGTARPASDEDLALLVTLAGMVNILPDVQVVIEGRTDQTGSASFNRELGLKRARAVADLLIKDGVPQEKIVRIRSFGGHGLFCEDITESCLAKNRRVVIRLFY